MGAPGRSGAFEWGTHARPMFTVSVTLFVMGVITWLVGKSLEAWERPIRERRLAARLAEVRAHYEEQAREHEAKRRTFQEELAAIAAERERVERERQARERERLDRRRRDAVRLRDEQRLRLGLAPLGDRQVDGEVVLHYLARRVDGSPWLVWRFWPELGRIEVCDAPTRTWATAGWPARYLAGRDPNFTDLAPEAVGPALDELAAPQGGR